VRKTGPASHGLSGKLQESWWLGVGVLALGCGPAPGAESAASSTVPAPATSEGATSSEASRLSSSQTSSPAAVSKAPEAAGALEPYKLTITPSAASASTKEEITIAWRVEGGPKPPGGIVPKIQFRVTHQPVAAPLKPGAKPEPKMDPVVMPAEDVCSVPALAKGSFVMGAKRNAVIQAEVVGCRGNAALEETRARGLATIEWVAPYIAELDVPGVLMAGSTAQGTVKFRGVDGPGSPGAPPNVKVTSNHPGVTITRQPSVAAASTFDIAIKADVTGEAKLTAEHVETNGSGKITGVLRKTAFVQVRSAKR
jgi:hypothetical protein